MWFRRKNQENSTDRALATLHEIQAKMLAQNQEFLVKVAEMALSSAGRALGVRSAKGRRRNKDGTFIPTPKPAKCALCADPLTIRPTIAMIDFHRQHQNSNGDHDGSATVITDNPQA